MIRVPNLYRHADGGVYCLLSSESPMKHPDSGDWIDGVIYTGCDGVLRSTSRVRWGERFRQVAEITEAELTEAQLQMVRRSNPGELSSGFNFTEVLESWTESETGVVGHMLELAIAATLVKAYQRAYDKPLRTADVTLMTSDLQTLLQTYEVERVPIPHGFIVKVRSTETISD